MHNAFKTVKSKILPRMSVMNTLMALIGNSVTTQEATTKVFNKYFAFMVPATGCDPRQLQIQNDRYLFYPLKLKLLSDSCLISSQGFANTLMASFQQLLMWFSSVLATDQLFTLSISTGVSPISWNQSAIITFKRKNLCMTRMVIAPLTNLLSSGF